MRAVMSFFSCFFGLLSLVLRFADFCFQLGLQLISPFVLGNLAQHQLQAAQLFLWRLRAAVLLFGFLVLRRQVGGHGSNYLATSRIAATRASICCSLCKAVKLMRRSDFPSGTLGGRMAGTKNPRRRSSAAAATARAGSPMTIGIIWLEKVLQPTS